MLYIFKLFLKWLFLSDMNQNALSIIDQLESILYLLAAIMGVIILAEVAFQLRFGLNIFTM